MNKLITRNSFVLLLFSLVVFFACKSPNSGTPQIFCSTLVINADTNCLIYVDGDLQGTFNSGDAKKIMLCKGEHLVVAKSLDSSQILAKQVIVIGDSVSKVVDLQVAQKVTIAGAGVALPDTAVIPKKELEKVEPEDQPEETLMPASGTYQDPRDSRTYRTVRLGSQIWLAENLAYKASSGCWAYDNNESYVSQYGYLYDWETAKSACPPGWRLPNDGDYAKLIKYLGGFNAAGGKLKTTHSWSSPNVGATNVTSFSALPGGYWYNVKNGFYLMGGYGLWWTSSSNSANTAYYMNIQADNGAIFISTGNKSDGMAIRCIRN